MALKSAQLSAFVALLLVQSHCVSCYYNDCGVKLNVVDVNSAESPIILNYRDSRNYAGNGHRLQVLHPTYMATDCLVRNFFSDNGLASFACIQHQLQFPGLKTWPDNVSATSLIGARQGPVFDNFTLFTPEHPSAIAFEEMSGPIKCSGAVEPTMKKLDDGKYQIGYQMNAVDFLPVVGLTFTDQLAFAHAKILSIINGRPRIDESNESLRKGEVFKDLSIASVQLGSKHQHSLKIMEMLKNKLLSDNAIDNYLVYGQLLSKDDLFYIPEQRATFFLENTALIWNSINEGNWKMVGDVVRKLAHESVTDLDVYSGTLECLAFDKAPFYLHNLSNSTKHACVPKFLFKIALDKRPNSNRGIVFITVNDPSIQIADDGSIPSDMKFCDKKSECDQLYPEFSSPKKGYTYCCDLEDFVPWNEIQNNSVDVEVSDVAPPFYGGGIAFSKVPPPPPPPPLPPRAALPLPAVPASAPVAN